MEEGCEDSLDEERFARVFRISSTYSTSLVSSTLRAFPATNSRTMSLTSSEAEMNPGNPVTERVLRRTRRRFQGRRRGKKGRFMRTEMKVPPRCLLHLRPPLRPRPPGSTDHAVRSLCHLASPHSLDPAFIETFPTVIYSAVKGTRSVRRHSTPSCA
ncbi:hypothetical protein NL676_009728 [Syzygium grande]|nr:hypothetical protein NL676_009728 [Syzygium grande]